MTNTIAYTADHREDLELGAISDQQEDNCISVDLSRFSQYLPSACPDDCKIRDNEILCLRIWAQSEDPPIFTYKIQKELRHIDQKTCRSFVKRNLNIISYSSCILLGRAVALSGNMLGTILDCANVMSFLIDKKDRIFGEVIGKKLSRLSFKHMENVIENLQKIRSALPKKTNYGRATGKEIEITERKELF